MKRFNYFLVAVLSACLAVTVMAFANAKNELPDKHLEIVFRNIGHQLLLHSKDSTSRVLPVKKVNENTFRISFENAFGFTPDTLMNLVHQQLSKTTMPGDYTVSVNDCSMNQTVFAYEINSADGDLVPCRGRQLKKGCYTIDISFLVKKPFNYAWLLLSLIPIAFLGFYFYRNRNHPGNKKQQENGLMGSESFAVQVEPSLQTNMISGAIAIPNGEIDLPIPEFKQVGKFRFVESKGTLSLDDQVIELSEKEVKAMGLFAANQDQVVERDLLMKTIWEDEGVLVITRNVDVLISKLRKKLKDDPAVRIVNVHGKGYKLVTG